MTDTITEAEEKELSAGDSKAWAERWTKELSAGKKELENWHTQGAKILKRFRDERDESSNSTFTRWPLFSANITTQRAIMLGQTPKVNVSRRFADANDDVARVAAEILERLLNTDIEKGSDGFTTALSYALDDRLLPGLAMARVRYVAEFEDIEVPAQTSVDPLTGAPLEMAPAYTESRKTFEDVEVDWVHWRDVVWSPCRVFHELRWVGFRAQMPLKELKRRFGAIATRVPLDSDGKAAKDDSEDGRKATPWSRADVWEIWSKEHGKVFWFVEGMDEVLDVKDDPLGLEGFWPCPRPMIANSTTDTMIPRPDFVLHQDLYDEIDVISTRCKLLEEAIRVAGVYDSSNDGLKRLLSTRAVNELVPVANWNAYSEKGGLRGAIDWLPLDQVVGALTTLRDVRRELMDALYQVSGMSDIMRGQGTMAGVSATEQSIKAKFGSVRMQALQDEFARFASDIQRLKAEIIAKHFDAQTILERCGCEFTADAQLAPQAVELLKGKMSAYRVEVKPENVSLTDFAALKAERTEVLMGIAGFMQSAGPLATAMPGSMPLLLQILQWTLSGMRGASTIEGAIDAAITQAKQAADQQAAQPEHQTPDPKLMVEQLKSQAKMMQIDKELQADLVRSQADVAADEQREANQAKWNVREAASKASLSAAMRGPFNGNNGGIP